MWYISLFLLGASSVALAAVVPAQPVITPAPSLEDVELARRQGRIDLIALLPLLATAVPPSILALALTNVPAVSRLLWSEFLDDKTPAWFTALPTDVQQYLSGEFGPTMTASNTAVSTTQASSMASTSSAAAAASTALSNPRGEDNSGLPLWAKIVIGIAVPLLVIGLITGIILCCCQQRRSRRRKAETSRVHTPAFISSSHQQPQHSDRPAERVPLRGGYHSNSPSNSNHRTSHSSHHLSSSSDDFRTPVGGPSYEDIAPVAAAHPTHRSRRSSRQSLNSLHSVPEVPESMYHYRHGVTDATSIPPSGSPRRSRDLGHEDALNNGPLDNNRRRTSPLKPASVNNGGPVDRSMQPNHGTTGQGMDASYKNPYHNYDADYRPDNPFDDHSPPRQNTGYMSNRRNYHHGERRQSQDAELFIPDPSYQGRRPLERSYDNDSSWPLKNAHYDGYHNGNGRARSNSWEMGDDKQIYEM